jgi:glycosyltransferase involved in cell wall biosynthesis
VKVLHVTSGRLFGGVEQMLVTMARCRDVAPMLDSAFAVAAPGRLDDELRAAGAPVTALGDVRLSRPGTVFHARSRLRRALEHERPNVLVCHAPWAFALFAPIGRRAGVPCVFWQHDHASGRTLVERWARATEADRVICNSRWTAQSAAVLQPDAPASVVHPPVRLPERSPTARAEIRRALETDPVDIVILAAARLEPWKGQINILEAAARLSSLVSVPWTVWIAGAARRPHELRYEAELRQAAVRFGVQPRVRFLGERRDVPALMAAADVFCQPNDGPEPFGIVFAEALLSGLPVVTTNLGGAPEIVDASCGRLVPAGNLEALSEALRELVIDSGMRERLGAAGRAHAASRCAPEIVLPELARVLAALGADAAA